MTKTLATATLLSALVSTAPAFAQIPSIPTEPSRVRVGLGAQIIPSYPGADNHRVGPYWDLAIAPRGAQFDFEAPDENFGFPLVRTGGLEIGPSLNLARPRQPKDVGAPMDKVGRSLEVGGFIQYWLNPSLRARAELRQGLGGHGSVVGDAGVDYVMRDRDAWVVSVGPRLGFGSRGYNRAYYDVTPREAVATGLPVYDTRGGIQTIGIASGAQYALNKSWGIIGYAKYDRLVGDPGDSPLVRELGSRNQLSGGLGLTYTFNINRRK